MLIENRKKSCWMYNIVQKCIYKMKQQRQWIIAIDGITVMRKFRYNMGKITVVSICSLLWKPNSWLNSFHLSWSNGNVICYNCLNIIDCNANIIWNNLMSSFVYKQCCFTHVFVSNFIWKCLQSIVLYE